MFGHRHEGRRVKHLDPIIQMTPYLMPTRVDAMVFLQHDVEYEPLMRYIAEKWRDEGVKITFLEVIIASYVRAISQVPEVNRFIMNKQFYNRKELTVSMTILMDTPDGSLQENVIKVKYDPSDTIYDVAARLVQKIEANRKPETPGFSVKLASFALKIPGLLLQLPMVPYSIWVLRSKLPRFGAATATTIQLILMLPMALPIRFGSVWATAMTRSMVLKPGLQRQLMS